MGAVSSLWRRSEAGRGPRLRACLDVSGMPRLRGRDRHRGDHGHGGPPRARGLGRRGHVGGGPRVDHGRRDRRPAAAAGGDGPRDPPGLPGRGGHGVHGVAPPPPRHGRACGGLSGLSRGGRRLPGRGGRPRARSYHEAREASVARDRAEASRLARDARAWRAAGAEEVARVLAATAWRLWIRSATVSETRQRPRRAWYR